MCAVPCPQLGCLGVLTKSITYLVAIPEFEQELEEKGQLNEENETALMVAKFVSWTALAISSVTLLLVIGLLVGLSQV